MKDTYLQQVQTVATALAQTFDNARALYNSFFDRNYAAGAVNEFTPADLEAAGITQAQLSAFITLCEQLQKLRDGQAVTPGDYDSTLNALRRDI